MRTILRSLQHLSQDYSEIFARYPWSRNVLGFCLFCREIPALEVDSKFTGTILNKMSKISMQKRRQVINPYKKMEYLPNFQRIINNFNNSFQHHQEVRNFWERGR